MTQFQDAELGDKPLGVSRYPLLRYIYMLSTRKLVVVITVAVLVPTWLALYRVRGLSYVTDAQQSAHLEVGSAIQPPELVNIPPFPDLDEEIRTISTTAKTFEAIETASEATEDDVSDNKPPQSEQSDEPSPFSTSETAIGNTTPLETEKSAPAHSVDSESHQKEEQKVDESDESILTDDSHLLNIPAEFDTTGIATIPDPVPGEYRLVIIVPLDKPHPNLCKNVFSAMANGYPSPVVVNWGNEGSKISHLLKITKTLEYLDHMMGGKAHPDDKIHDNDLIVLVDGLDIWWQLPPEVLIKRYHESNRRANERLAREWGLPGFMTTHQSIIGATQKRCWPLPRMGANLHCDALPKSPSRPDLYGPSTDKGEEPRKYRPINLNSGTIMGPAQDFRRYLRRAQDRMSRVSATHPLIKSDQGLLGEVWGEQEVMRNWLRNMPNRANASFLEDPATQMVLESFEYYFGLDYKQDIVISTVFEEREGEIFQLNNQSYINKMSSKLGINPVRLTGVPEDMRRVQTPLRKFLPDQQTGDWGDLMLYADFFTESVPVILHNNAHIEGLKSRRVRWWNRTWYFPYLRRLITRYLERPQELLPLGTYTFGNQNVTYRALPSEKNNRKPRRFTPEMAGVGLPVMDFADICKAKEDETKWYDEIFRDGLGPL